MENEKVIRLYLDGEEVPFAEFTSPVKFSLDTTRIPDGKYQLKVVATSTNGTEGVKTIPFEVRNGPAIAVVGLKPHEVVTGQIPVTINAYGSERNDVFIVTGSETPKAIPAWVWALLVTFVAFSLFYFIMYWKPDLYHSFV